MSCWLIRLLFLGYVNIDRLKGFDYEGAKMILKDLATFHAVPVALKLKKRQLFQDKIKKNIGKPIFGAGPPKSEEDGEARPPSSAVQDMWLEVLEKHNQCKLFIPKLKKHVDEFKEKKSFFDRPKSEPFATISHNDMWVNNTMQIFKGDKMIKNKFVDFQMYSYDSPAQDLLFFIWSSVQLPVIKKYFNDLLKYYHTNFVEVLVELGCDSTPFSYEKFENELKENATHVIFQCFMMFVIIFGQKGAFALDMTLGVDETPFKKESITESLQERAAIMIQYFGKRGWL